MKLWLRWLPILLLLQLFACSVSQQAPDITVDKKTSDRVTQLRKDMLLRRARALVQYESIYHELEKLLPADPVARADINRYQQERSESAAQLFECGKQSFTDKNLALAEECLNLSQQLAKTDDKKSLLDKIRSQRKQQEVKRLIDQLLQAYQQAYENGSLAEASAQLDALLVQSPDHDVAQSLRTKLDSEIKTRLDQDMETARQLYSQGKVNESLQICNGLLLLDPRNEELLALISRAEKVSKNMEKLSKPKK